MTSMQTQAPRVAQLAQMIEHDILRRGLLVGDPYLTSDEVGAMLGVHTRTASRAMVELAHRRVLQRKRGVGTFVGPEAPMNEAILFRCIHVLVTQERLRTGFNSDSILAGLTQAMPGVQVQFNVLPPNDVESHVRQLIQHYGRASGTMAGLVLVGCPRPVQEIVAAHHVPTVVFGGVYPTTATMPSIDVDHEQVGRLMVEHLLHRGCRNFALMLREHWLPGDNALFDGINHALGDRGMRHGSLTIRSLPTVHSAIAQEVDRLIEQLDANTGWIARGRLFAEVMLERLQAHGLKPGQDVTLIADDDDSRILGPRGMAVIQPDLDYQRRAQRVADLLSQQIQQPTDPVQHIAVPVSLIVPDA